MAMTSNPEWSAVAAVEHDSRELFTLSIRAMEATGLDVAPSGLRALLVLDDAGPCTLGELAQRLVLSQSATSRMVDRLVTRDLIDRATASSDRRQLTLTLTAAGRDATTRLVRRRRDAITTVMGSMTDGQRSQLRRGLRAFAAAAAKR